MTPTMNTTRRRWYQLSLRTFFVLVTLACVGFGYWVHWSREWIKQRQEEREQQNHWYVYTADRSGKSKWPAPAGLWLFGEEGIESIICFRGTLPDEVDRMRRLFPEAKVLEDN